MSPVKLEVQNLNTPIIVLNSGNKLDLNVKNKIIIKYNESTTTLFSLNLTQNRTYLSIEYTDGPVELDIDDNVQTFDITNNILKIEFIFQQNTKIILNCESNYMNYLIENQTPSAIFLTRNRSEDSSFEEKNFQNEGYEEHHFFSDDTTTIIISEKYKLQMVGQNINKEYIGDSVNIVNKPKNVRLMGPLTLSMMNILIIMGNLSEFESKLLLRLHKECFNGQL
ncbi:uncharacterized protein VNE69_02239 [Vairimorpha necatrix]|uniref:Uncharacterized protein n=1 Tax=Vairimorpha necatrix TaxID=6039 RepID=A0AAX4J9T7_9MICR